MSDRTPTAFLTADAPVPVETPFTRAQARAEGVTDRQLARWVSDGLLLTPLHGVYYAAQLPDGLELRAACLRLVAPPDAVVTGRSAGWFHGASMILAPNDHLVVPKISIHLSPGNRLRNEFATSGERTFLPGEVVEVAGLRVSSKLRTTCDLGMMRNREQAFAAMDQMANVADFDLSTLVKVANSRRFRGYRHVRQFRALVPHVRRGSESGPESVVRLRWIDCADLPYPKPQAAVPGPKGWYYVDVGNEELRYGVEYFGEEFHGPEQETEDERRLSWLDEKQDWEIDVLRKHHIYGSAQSVERILRAGVARARRRYGARAWTGQDRRPGSNLL